MDDTCPPSPPGESRRSKRLTASQRLGVITLVENNVLRPDEVAHLYGITKPAVQYILKNRDKIKARVVSVENPSTIGRYPELENYVYQQVVAAAPAGDVTSITNVDIKEAAIEFARVNGLDGFRASTTWIDNFKVRYNIGSFSGSAAEQMASMTSGIPGSQYIQYPPQSMPMMYGMPTLPQNADQYLLLQLQQVHAMGNSMGSAVSSTAGVLPLSDPLQKKASKPKRRKATKKRRADDDDDDDLDDDYDMSNEDD